MPKSKKNPNLTDRQERAVENYFNYACVAGIPGYTWTNAMTDAGYKFNYVNNNSHYLWGNIRVQEALAEKKAKLAEECGLSNELQIKRITDNYLRSKKENDRRTELAALDQLNRSIGFYNKDEGSNEKPPQQLTINDIKVLIQTTQGPQLPENLGIAGSQTGHIRPQEAVLDEKEQ